MSGYTEEENSNYRWRYTKRLRGKRRYSTGRNSKKVTIDRKHLDHGLYRTSIRSAKQYGCPVWSALYYVNTDSLQMDADILNPNLPAEEELLFHLN